MRDPQMSFGMPRPGKAVLGMMIAMTAIWILFAVGINWLHVGDEVFALLIGSGEGLRHGHLWVFFTAPVIHHFKMPGSLLMPLFGLFFFGTTLEDRWGPKKMLAFLFGSAAFAFLVQVGVGAIVPQLKSSVWFGSLGMTEAVAVAWALNNRNATVRLFFVLPVSGTMLLVFIFVASLFSVLALTPPTEGLVTPFGGMLAGWLFGDTSPLRRFVLQLRLRRLQKETEALRTGQAAARRRAAGPPLRIIHGGGDTPPKDKRYLN